MNIGILGDSHFFPIYSSENERMYEYLTSFGKQYDCDFIRYSLYDYDLIGKKFKRGRVYDGEKYFKVDKQPDIIWPKFNVYNFISLSIAEKYPFLNSPKITELCYGKYITALMVKEYSPRTQMAFFFKKNYVSIDKLIGDRFVVKPNTGYKGHGVKKYSRPDLLNFIEETDFYILKQIIIQEMIDSSSGIPNIVEGIHDIRCVCFGLDVVYVIIRTPENGDFRCNLAQAGSQRIMDFDIFPDNIKKDVAHILQRISEIAGTKNFHISIDICVDKDGKTKLIELNSSLGLKHLQDNEHYRKLYAQKLCEYAINFMK